MNPTQLACKHMEFAANCRMNRLEDTGRFNLEVNVHCVQCGLPFHFPGPPFGLLISGPSVNPDRTQLRCPIVPGPAEIVGHNAVFQMAPTTEQN